MAFVKVQKTDAYYSRFQVAKRRRREGKTDYQARRNLIRQDKTKYNTPKYRFVVRSTNSKIICQIVYSKLCGDIVLCAAESTELPRYGMPVGLTNYAAAYMTGLLCARRCLKTIGLDAVAVGKEVADGEEYHIEDETLERRPFKCVLDIGLVRTTTGNRVFGALKGACDGGLYIPHSNKRFPGYVRGEEGAEDSYDAAGHRDRIFAKHVSNYMGELKEEEPEKYEQLFSQYIKHNITAESLEETIKAAHAAIRANPERVKAEKKQIVKAVRDGNYIKTVGKDGQEVKYLNPKRLTKEQRRARVHAKLAEVAKRVQAALDEQ